MSVKAETPVADEKTANVPGVPLSAARQPMSLTATTTNNTGPFPLQGFSFRDDPPAPQRSSARVPIPPQRSLSESTEPSPTGPMSASVVVPPRPRPGRKPIQQDDAVDRRRLQNRVAQRNFRDKRQQKLWETQKELEARKNEYQETVNELERQRDEYKQDAKAQREQIDELTRRLAGAEARAERAESKLQQAGQGYSDRISNPFTPARFQPATAPPLAINTNQSQFGMYGSSSVPTPPEDHTFALEQDFTRWRSGNQQSNALRPTISNESSGMNFASDFDPATGSGCGFCSKDGGFCACKETQQPAECAPAPGTCAACQADPRRAEQCRDLAKAAQFASRPSTSEGPRMFEASPGGLGGSMSMGPPQRNSCSYLVDQFRSYGERTSSISELFGEQLNAFPSAHGGFDVDQQQAAQVLQSLSRRNTIISPQESNERSSFGNGSQR